MDDKTLLRAGIIGTGIAVVCCATPVLVILFGALGISALMGPWLDYYVLFPLLGLSVALIVFALYRKKRHARRNVTPQGISQNSNEQAGLQVPH